MLPKSAHSELVLLPGTHMKMRGKVRRTLSGTFGTDQTIVNVSVNDGNPLVMDVHREEALIKLVSFPSHARADWLVQNSKALLAQCLSYFWSRPAVDVAS